MLRRAALLPPLCLVAVVAAAQEPPPAPPGTGASGAAPVSSVTPGAVTSPAKADPDEPARARLRDGLARQRAWAEVGRRVAELEGELAAATSTTPWVQKGILCIELADLMDRRAVGPLARALPDKEPLVVAFALHGLARQTDEDLRKGGGAPLVQGLIDALKVRAYYHRRVAHELLVRVTGEDVGQEAGKWKGWLRRHEGELALEDPTPPFDPARADPKLLAQVEAEGQQAGTSVRPRIPSVARELEEMNRSGLDVAICLDQTGSMGAVLDEAKQRIRLLTMLVGLVVKDSRFGLATYDDGLKVFVPLTRDAGALQGTLERIQAAGGGDEPEGVDKAIDATLRPDFGWRRGAAKCLIVIGDAPPHDPDLPHAREQVTLMRARLEITTNAVSTGGSHVAAFDDLARAGGGQSLLLGEPARLVSEVLLLIFGERMRPAMERFVPVLMEIHEEERTARGGR
jgi:Mg-chelatase subunit ChlD